MTDLTTKAEKDQPRLIRRIFRTTARVTTTIVFIGAAGIAVQFGSNTLAQRAEAAPTPAPAPVMPVETRPITLQASYSVSRAFLGQVEAQRTGAISFELNGQLQAIYVDEGDVVEAGQLVAALDTRLLSAERARLQSSQEALEAQLRFADQTVARLSQLSDRGFASDAQLDEATARGDELRARLGELDAALSSNAIQIEKSQVFAPFDGQITDRRVDGGESIAAGQSLFGIVENSAPNVRVGVPLDITEAGLASALVEIGGTQIDAALIALRPDVDPVTRTRTAIFSLATDAGSTFGQTARLLLGNEVATPGMWVPVTSLQEGQRGQWTLLAVDGDNVVRSVSVQILHTQGEQVFVAGAFPEDLRLVASGPQRVTVGQVVDPQPAT